MDTLDRLEMDKRCLLKEVHPVLMKEEKRKEKELLNHPLELLLLLILVTPVLPHLLEHQAKREEEDGLLFVTIVTNEVILGHVVFNFLQILEESIKRDLNLVEVPSKNGLRRLKAGVMLHSLHLKLALGSHGTLIVGVQDI